MLIIDTISLLFTGKMNRLDWLLSILIVVVSIKVVIMNVFTINVLINIHNNQNMPTLPQPLFNHYTLAQQWPPSACKKSHKRCTNQIPRNFTIHGLWPSNAVPLHPRNCIIPSSFDSNRVSSSQSSVIILCILLYMLLSVFCFVFTLQQIQSLVPRLSIAWPNLNGINKKFWKSQWDKHGSCSSFNQFDYFKHAIYLWSRNDLTSILQEEGITPGGSYDKQHIIDVIFNNIGVIPTLTCVGNNSLAEIHLCFDPTFAIIYMDCPSSHRQTCAMATIFFEA